MTDSRIIAIDGTAGSGKSTTARLVARKLGFGYLDTGAMYRTAALLAVRQNCPLTDGEAIAALISKHSIDIRDGCIRLDGQDVSAAIRAPGMGERASLVSAHPPVRRQMVSLQRRVCSHRDMVVEGRDMGTVVFPDADLKVYMTAEIEERAHRRLGDIKGNSPEDLPTILDELRRRDDRDRTRSDSPLKPAPDSKHLDTTNLTIEEQVEAIIDMWKESHPE